MTSTAFPKNQSRRVRVAHRAFVALATFVISLASSSILSHPAFAQSQVPPAGVTMLPVEPIVADPVALSPAVASATVELTSAHPLFVTLRPAHAPPGLADVVCATPCTVEVAPTRYTMFAGEANASPIRIGSFEAAAGVSRVRVQLPGAGSTAGTAIIVLGSAAAVAGLGMVVVGLMENLIASIPPICFHLDLAGDGDDGGSCPSAPGGEPGDALAISGAVTLAAGAGIMVGGIMLRAASRAHPEVSTAARIASRMSFAVLPTRGGESASLGITF
jgi:hypothetical protein